jgi:hypothetical protein
MLALLLITVTLRYCIECLNITCTLIIELNTYFFLVKLFITVPIQIRKSLQLTGLLQSQELHLEDCFKFHQLFVDEFLSLVDALSFVLTEPNVQAVVELEMEVHTPAVPPALQA